MISIDKKYAFKAFFLLVACIFYSTLNTGVIVLADLPDGIKDLVCKAREYVKAETEKANNNGQELIFYEGRHGLHMTFAYLTNQKLSMQEFKNKYPLVEYNLAMASARNPIDISSSLKESHLEIWQGKKATDYQDKIYHNYVILVIKIKPSDELIELAEKTKLTTNYHTDLANEIRLDFNAHATIGRIFDKNDIEGNAQYFAEKIKTGIEKLISSYDITSSDFLIDCFYLSAEDGKQKFELSNADDYGI